MVKTHDPETKTMNRHSTAALVLCLTAGLASAQSLSIGTERSFPKSWSQPQVVKNTDGSITYKPSIPQDFETRIMGTGLTADAVAVSVRTDVPNAATYEIRLRNGTAIKVKEGASFRAGTDTWRVLGADEAGKLRLKNVTSGQVLILGRRAARPK